MPFLPIAGKSPHLFWKRLILFFGLSAVQKGTKIALGQNQQYIFTLRGERGSESEQTLYLLSAQGVNLYGQYGSVYEIMSAGDGGE